MKSDEGVKILETMVSVERQLNQDKFADPFEGYFILGKLQARYLKYLKERKYN